MADYYAFPLWAEDGMLSPEELPLTDALRDELDLWSADYTRAGAGTFLRGRVLR
ncbi:hypothetical protein [Frankia sp. AgKG'84/4]|uniref:hypothetical protein n=1 Tax=Frankia sp. AgKG'84/4 TaxID=573490 RepID=UPI00200D18FE|nr:hypothetical protein [Frankia sp. AgKG'84/4]